LRGRFTSGIALFGLGLLLSGIAPSVALALPAFAVAGFGNGLLLVHERVLVQESVPDGVLARAFGVKDALASWAFGLAFFCAGALLTLTSARELIVAAGVGALLVWAATLPLLRRRGGPAGQAVLEDSG
jgi:MFS family permease